tara:strand:- start:322 stop:882 length:561 start_codon:yes stop_codon:yes gene_type:complete
MADTVLGGGIELLQEFGFFDVVLPFLLIFTIVFGILEKTRIFGTEDYNGTAVPKKNLNAMIAFVIAFFFITAAEIVTSIQESLPLVALILIAIISFLMLLGTFASSETEFKFFDAMGDGWKLGLAIVFIITIVLIFFHSFGWLEFFYDYFAGIGSDVFIMVVFVGITAGIIAFVFKGGSSSSGGDE